RQIAPSPVPFSPGTPELNYVLCVTTEHRQNCDAGRVRRGARGTPPAVADLMDRQKKLLLFGAAWVSALLLTWLFYSQAAAPRTEKMLRVVVASHDMPLGTLLRHARDLK